MPRKNQPATIHRRRVFSRTKHSGKTTSTRVSTPLKRSSGAPRVKILRRIGALTRRLPMALVTCSKKQPARTSPTSSPTKEHLTFKERMHKLDEKWNKCRPYLERINGVAVPLRQSFDEQDAGHREFQQQGVQRQPVGTAH